MPFLNWQRWLAYGAIAVLVAGLLELDGYRRGEKKLWEYQAAQANQAVRIVVKRGEVTERVVTRYVKVAGETQVVTKTIEKEVLRYAEAHPSAACLDDDWRRLHDAAAANELPEPAAGPDGGVPAAEPDPAGDGDHRAQHVSHGHGELRAAP